MTERCGKKYGKRGQLRCGRPPGHPGRHALQANIAEMRFEPLQDLSDYPRARISGRERR